MAEKKKTQKKEKKDYTMSIAVIFVLLVLVFGYYAIREKKEVNPLENKLVVDMNTTCEKAWEGAEIFAQIYNISNIVSTEEIIIAECAATCQEKNASYEQYKCTSSNQFLCYCNKQ